jgi:bacterioferritin-associated ferredoxin
VIRQCIRDGARSTDEVGDACGAGTRCGGCRPTIESLLCGENAGDVEQRGIWALLEPKAA